MDDERRLGGVKEGFWITASLRTGSSDGWKEIKWRRARAGGGARGCGGRVLLVGKGVEGEPFPWSLRSSAASAARAGWERGRAGATERRRGEGEVGEGGWLGGLVVAGPAPGRRWRGRRGGSPVGSTLGVRG